MSYKKFLLYFMISTLIIAGLYSAFIYAKDPLGYYKLEKESKYFYTNGRYQLPAFIKNLDYDSIIIGPSMSQNFHEEIIDEVLGIRSFNAALSAASAKEQNYIYQLADKTHENLNFVFWEINFDSLYGASNRVNEDSGEFPSYLYNTFPLDDFRYLFSYYAGEMILEKQDTLKTATEVKIPYQIYKFGQGVPPLRVEPYKRLEIEYENNKPVPEGVSFEDMKKNFDTNILPVIQKHPEQKFILYYTPYPVVYHIFNYNRSYEAFIDRLELKEYIIEQVKELKNVEVHDFQAESKVTFKISNYMDGSHYFAVINDWMTEQFANKAYQQTVETTKQNNLLLLKQVEGFDYRQLKED